MRASPKTILYFVKPGVLKEVVGVRFEKMKISVVVFQILLNYDRVLSLKEYYVKSLNFVDDFIKVIINEVKLE